MQGDDDGDSLRDAVAGLRAARDELPALAEQLDGAVQGRVDGVSGAVEQAAQGRPDLLTTAHEIRLIGTRMTAAREDAFAAVTHVLTGYADEIEALLRAAGTPDVDIAAALAAITIPPLPAPATDVVTTAQETVAVQQHLPDTAAQEQAIAEVVACCPGEYQQLVGDLLTGHSAHAVERHGHHLTPAQMIARLQWLLDPASIDHWQLNPDGSVDSWRDHGNDEHQVGISAGHYTSPEAVAKPLLALLRLAGSTQAEFDGFLDGTANGETIVKVFLRTSDTGVTAEDVYTQRAPGTDTRNGKKMWKRARRGAMAGHGDTPGVREHDMVGRGKRPGSLIVFAKRQHESWRLITSYFADDPHRVPYLEL